jgi:hypothetical protein
MPFGYATFFGRRVTKENARMANGATIAFDEARIVFVECDGPIIRNLPSGCDFFATKASFPVDV